MALSGHSSLLHFLSRWLRQRRESRGLLQGCKQRASQQANWLAEWQRYKNKIIYPRHWQRTRSILVPYMYLNCLLLACCILPLPDCHLLSFPARFLQQCHLFPGKRYCLLPAVSAVLQLMKIPWKLVVEACHLLSRVLHCHLQNYRLRIAVCNHNDNIFIYITM